MNIFFMVMGLTTVCGVYALDNTTLTTDEARSLVTVKEENSWFGKMRSLYFGDKYLFDLNSPDAEYECYKANLKADEQEKIFAEAVAKNNASFSFAKQESLTEVEKDAVLRKKFEAFKNPNAVDNSTIGLACVTTLGCAMIALVVYDMIYGSHESEEQSTEKN